MSKRWGFTYLFCNDLVAMREFYTGVLGLKQIWQDESSVAYDIAGHQLSITYDERFSPAPAAFARQPGWTGGSEPRTSWSLECDADSFKTIVGRAIGAGTESFWPEARWVGYWSLPLLDPMGNTVEVTCPQERLD